MNYIKKIWNYQQLLLSSVQFGNYGLTDRPNSANNGCLPILLLPVMYGFLTYVFEGSNTIFLMILGVVYTYGIATSNRKLYVLAPVTRRFALFCLYLLPFIIALLAYFVLTAGLIIFIAVLIIFKIPQDNAPTSSDVIASAGGYKTILFCILFIVIVSLITISISVIRARKTRLISLTIFVTITMGLLVWLKKTLPAVPATNEFNLAAGLSNLLPGFENMAYSGLILIFMAVFLTAVAPLSINFAYREFMCDKTKKPI